MALLACIWPVVMTCIWQPLVNAVQSCVETQAGDCLAGLANWVTTPLFASWRRSTVEEVPVSSDSVVDVVEVPTSSASVVGAEETLSEIQEHLSNDSVGVIGIYGMGGIGKTTLLQKINNDFYNSVTQCPFDVVIWVTVSQEVSIPKIQKQIGHHLGLSFSDKDDAPVDEQARDLFTTLSKKQFLVLLDDVWEKLDLVKIGVPLPEGRRRNCKVAFTTRLLRVCDDMDVDKHVGVKLLEKTRSWDLFCSKLRTDVVLTDPAIGSLAQQVVRRCGGLPLALITVGKAMARRRDSSDWEHAVKALDRAAEQLRGMDQVLSCLKFSYDYLENDRMRSALVFCAMYPEDQDIHRLELIRYWDGEGLLEDGDLDAVNDDRIEDARRRGRELINNLLDACLLELGIGFAEQCVRLHDAVRDMLLWVNKRHERHDKEVDRFLVIDKAHTATQLVAKREGQHVESNVKRIWMRGMEFSKLSDPSYYYFPAYPMCTWTLLLNEARRLGSSHLRGIVSRMTTLRVLDLSKSSIEELPVEIGLLGELRYLNLLYNFSIKELPVEIGSLGELRYLNLSSTKIMSLPRELGGLVRLRQLELNGTSKLQLVPREAIAGLSSLQVLHMLGSGYDWGTRCSTSTTAMEATSAIEEETKTNQQHSSSLGVVTGDGAAGGGLSRESLELGDLEGLERLQGLEITLPSSPELIRKLISASDKLRKCIKGLVIRCELDLMRQQQLLADDEFHPRVGEMRFSLDPFPWLPYLRLIQEGIQQREEGDQLGSIMVVTLVGAAAINPSSGGSRSGGAVASSSSSIPTLSLFHVWSCHSFKELKLTGRFPCLEGIWLWDCGGMEEVVLDGDGGDVGSQEEELCQGRRCCCFPMLKEIHLFRLPALKSIAVRGPPSLHLPSLETLRVRRCPELRRLPFSSTPPNLKMIRGEQEWWDALDWGGSSDSANLIKSTFAPFFVPRKY